ASVATVTAPSSSISLKTTAANSSITQTGFGTTLLAPAITLSALTDVNSNIGNAFVNIGINGGANPVTLTALAKGSVFVTANNIGNLGGGIILAHGSVGDPLNN